MICRALASQVPNFIRMSLSSKKNSNSQDILLAFFFSMYHYQAKYLAQFKIYKSMPPKPKKKSPEKKSAVYFVKMRFIIEIYKMQKWINISIYI